LRRLERHSGFLPALGADRFRLDSLVIARARIRRALCFAVLAPLGLVFEALIGEETLLARRKHEFRATFRTP
jgi:hypothetical protein